MEIVIGVIVGLVVLMFLVVAHEFGHFLMARQSGVNVVEFGIGFPPRAIAWIKDPKTGKWRRLPRKEWNQEGMTKVVYSESKAVAGKVGAKTRKGKFWKGGLAQRGMVFSINWLPIGGFCQMDGESDSETRKGTFGAASFWGKTKILFAGVAMNWLVAAVILTILAWVGMPEFLDNQFTVPIDTRVDWKPVMISEVIAESPASRADLEVGDYILSIDGNKMEYASDITAYDKEHAGQTVEFEVKRGEDTVKTEVALNNSDAEYLVGIAMQSSEVKSYSTWSAPIVGVGLTAQLTGETFKGVGLMLWNLVTGVGSQFSPDQMVRQNGQEAIVEVGDSVSGPVGIIGVLFPAFTAMGPANLAFLAALISVSLACMNVLPIPALDGGRWLLIAIFKLRHKKLTKEIEQKIVSRAFIVLLALIFIVTILDIVRMVR